MTTRNGSKYGWLAMWLGIAGSAIVIGGSALSVITNMTAQSLTLSQHTTKLADLEKDLFDTRGIVNDLRSQVSSLRVSLNEIETQFCAEDIVRNLMHENNTRLQSAIYQKVFGQPLATDNAYYPVICNRSPYGPTAGSGRGSRQ
jgi:hypothetical protein